MPAPDVFDLEAAVAGWRARLARSHTLRGEELDELEAHLWDVVDARMAGGEAAREAFEAALWQVGHASLIEHAFRTAHEAEGPARRPLWQHHPWIPVMLTSYLKIALRNLRRQPGYAFINVAGLGLGVAASLVILLYAHHELTYDRFHPDAGRIHLLYKERITPAGTQVTRDTWVPLAERLKHEFPAVEEVVRVWDDQQWVRHGDRRFQERVTYTDATLWDVFHFPLAQGDPETAFRDRYSAVVSKNLARKYFDEADPIGQTILVDNTTTYTVTGVFEDIPTNSSIRIDLAIPLASAPDYAGLADNWGSAFLFTYVRLKEGADPAALEAQFPGFITRIWDAEETTRTVFRLEALPEIWNNVAGNRAYAYILVGIAVAILLIAAINFTNLSTARSLERAREIGMRKVLGAGRRQLVGQFLGESMVMSFGALAVGVLLAEAALPFFEDLYAIELGLPYVRQPLVVLLLAGMGAGIGLLAGAYPALVLSGFQPISALQGRFRSGRSGRLLRHGLVVTQFTLAAALIMGTLLVRSQIGYMQHANLQFDKDNLVILSVRPGDFEGPEAAAARLQTFKDELRKLGGVVSVSSSSHVPGNWGGWFTFIYPGDGTDDDRLRMRYAVADHRYFETYGIPFVEGRAFDEARPTDQDAVILNEAAMKAFGWTSAEGKTVRRGDQYFQVIGVVRDYHFEPLRNAIEPVVQLYRQPDHGVHQFVSVRIRPGAVPATLAAMEALWRRVDPGRALPYTFADDQFAQLYQAEERLATVAGAFTGLAILIACLGLFGLASWMVTRRVKEVGIRKTMGASVAGIAVLIAKDFARLVLAAIVLAVPLAYLGIDAWLTGFAYRIEVADHAGVFVLAGALALAIALATVSYHAVRAARSNPVQALRYE